MARSKDEMTTYVQDLCKEKGLSEENTRIAVAAYTGDAQALAGVDPAKIAEVTAPLLDLTVGRLQDYSKAMDGVKKHRESLDSWRTNEVLPELNRSKQAAQAAQQEVTKYKVKYGELKEGEEPPDPSGKGGEGDVNAEDFKREVKGEMARDFFGFQYELDELQDLHEKYFPGKTLRVRPLIDAITAAANNPDPQQRRILSYKDAYQLVHGEDIKKAEEKAAKAHDDAIRADERKKAEKEILARSSGRSGAAVPAGTGAFWDHVTRDQKTADVDKLSDADRQSLFESDLVRTLEKNEADMESRINNG